MISATLCVTSSEIISDSLIEVQNTSATPSKWNKLGNEDTVWLESRDNTAQPREMKNKKFKTVLLSQTPKLCSFFARKNPNYKCICIYIMYHEESDFKLHITKCKSSF